MHLVTGKTLNNEVEKKTINVSIATSGSRLCVSLSKFRSEVELFVDILNKIEIKQFKLKLGYFCAVFAWVRVSQPKSAE